MELRYKTLRGLPLLCLLLFTGMTFHLSAQSSSELNKQGRALYDAGDYRGALAKYDRSLAIEDYYYTYYLRFLAYDKLDEEDRAVENIDKAVDLAPDDLQLRYIRGLTREMYVGYGLAEDDYDFILSREPDNVKVLVARGSVRASMKYYDKALDDLDKAISLDPSHADAYEERGEVYDEQEKFDLAFSDLSKSISLEPTEYRYFKRATIQDDLGNLQAAISDFSTAIRMDPSDVTNHNLRASVYKKLGDMESMCADYQRACDLGDDFSCKRVGWNCEEEEEAPSSGSSVPGSHAGTVSFEDRLQGGTESIAYKLHKEIVKGYASTERIGHEAFISTEDMSTMLETELEDLAVLMKEHPNHILTVGTHLGYDAQVLEAVNRARTKMRTEKIRDFLVNKGISSSRIRLEAHGSTMPLAPNSSAEGRQLNNRVEFRLENP